jgi:hypothetical protein
VTGCQDELYFKARHYSTQCPPMVKVCTFLCMTLCQRKAMVRPGQVIGAFDVAAI